MTFLINDLPKKLLEGFVLQCSKKKINQSISYQLIKVKTQAYMQRKVPDWYFAIEYSFLHELRRALGLFVQQG